MTHNFTLRELAAELADRGVKVDYVQVWRFVHAKVPYGHWRTMTFLAALRCDRIDAPCVIDQPINAQSFTNYVGQCLMPTLAPGDVVIMDNLSSHKKPAIRSAIRP